MNEKPRFYLMDLENYTPEFLCEIIRWQDEKITKLEETSRLDAK